MEDATERDEGGEPVCLAHLVCPDCGAVTSEGHRAGCGRAEQTAVVPAPDDEALAGLRAAVGHPPLDRGPSGPGRRH
jgi:hypothetical protein